MNKKLVLIYDVNSLYPYVMTKDLPVAFVAGEVKKNNFIKFGYIVYFEGDISKVDPNAYGFFHVTISCPDNINDPILQEHFKTEFGTRTIYPTGT